MKNYLLLSLILFPLLIAGCSAKPTAPTTQASEEPLQKIEITEKDKKMFSYIKAFLNRSGVEGPQQIVGYVPSRPKDFKGLPSQNPANFTAIASSGVTIGTGVDLGQSPIRSLIIAGVSQDLIEKVKPYLGKSKEEAIAILAEKPLRITRAEADELDICTQVETYKVRILPVVTDFESLPQEAQIVIFSLCYQFGIENVERKIGITWNYLMNHDWKSASRELRYGFEDSPYKYRRRLEGKLLAKISEKK